MNLLTSLTTIQAELIVSVGAIILLMLSAFKSDSNASFLPKLAISILLIAAAGVVTIGEAPMIGFDGLILRSSFTDIMKVIILTSASITLWMLVGNQQRIKSPLPSELSVLVLLSVVGMMIMISAQNFLVLYIGLELQSLCLYVMASLAREDEKSSEAGLKYFVLGSIASAILLYGVSLLYGSAGSISFAVFKDVFASGALPLPALIGLICVMVGLLFKVSAVPFHMWTPDVYQGSPLPVTAFFAAVPKVAGIVILMRILMDVFANFITSWQQIIIVVAIASMLIGSLGAIMQTNIKRLLAFSSIGHVGNILVGVAAGNEAGLQGIVMYLIIYVVLTLGMFAAVMIFTTREDYTFQIDSLSGLARAHPLFALAIAVFMLSMAGIPPFAGFFGKYMVYLAAVQAGLYPLAIIGILTSVVGAYYYLRIIKIMYFDAPRITTTHDFETRLSSVMSISAIANVIFVLLFPALITWVVTLHF